MISVRLSLHSPLCTILVPQPHHRVATLCDSGLAHFRDGTNSYYSSDSGARVLVTRYFLGRCYGIAGAGKYTAYLVREYPGPVLAKPIFLHILE